ncbi:hypothetical protein UZ38_23065 [Bacillus amyloliquefaciens]|nr:hypothetical protein UZ38_23065 [Bacillus amyloliquefaciens]
MSEKIRCYTPYIPDGIGPTTESASEALNDIYNDFYMDVLPVFQHREHFGSIVEKIESCPCGFQEIWPGYRIKISLLTQKEIDTMPEWEGY